MEVKKCFKCGKEKSLDEFKIDRMKYQLPSDKGRCKVCKDCDLFRAMMTKSICRYNFELKKFEVIKFETRDEVYDYVTKRVD